MLCYAMLSVFIFSILYLSQDHGGKEKVSSCYFYYEPGFIIYLGGSIRGSIVVVSAPELELSTLQDSAVHKAVL